MTEKVELGDKVRDIITGLEGIATARIEYIYDCVQLRVTPPYNKEKGEQPKNDWVDEPQLEVLVKGAVEKSRLKKDEPPKHGGERDHPED